MKEPYKKANRVWLNPLKSDDDGMLKWEVEQNGQFVTAEFSIWDCSRKASLSFDFSSVKNKYSTSGEERAKKLDLLIKELTDMRKAMGEAYVLAHESEQPCIETLSAAEILGEDE